MVKHGVSMCDMISGVIQDGQLSDQEEDLLSKLLVQRSHARRCGSLVEYIERESRKVADFTADDIKERQGRLCKYCIQGSSIGGKDVSSLTIDDIRKFIIQTAVLYEMDRKSWFVFLTMLQIALNAMSSEGVLQFDPPRGLQTDFSEFAKRKRSVEKPYSGEEWGRVKGWLEQNPKDVRCLAISLWFEGGISPEEIAGLKKSDLMDISGKYSTDPVVVKKNASEDYLVLTPSRKRIIHAALGLYPGEDQEFVFMDENNGILERMSKKSLQPKLAFICRKVGVVYKMVKCTDMVLWGLGD